MMFATSKDVWLPTNQRKLSATTKHCKCCRRAGENLKSNKPYGKVGETLKPREANNIAHLDFCSPVIIALVLRDGHLHY